jgi:hypothetical protein
MIVPDELVEIGAAAIKDYVPPGDVEYVTPEQMTTLALSAVLPEMARMMREIRTGDHLYQDGIATFFANKFDLKVNPPT